MQEAAKPEPGTLPQHTIELAVLVTVHTGVTAHDAAHQIAGLLTGNGWRAEVGPLAELKPARTVSPAEDDHNAERARCGCCEGDDVRAGGCS